MSDNLYDLLANSFPADRSKPVGGLLDDPPGATRITRRLTWISFGFLPVRSKKLSSDRVLALQAVPQFLPNTYKAWAVLKSFPQ